MDNQPQPTSPWVGRLVYLLTIVVVAALSVGIVALLMNINQRKREAEQQFFPIVKLDENSIDPKIWGQNFPRQYASYLKTAEGTLHGGSDALPKSKLEADPRLTDIYAGYAFSIDFRDKRGHAYMLKDQDDTLRVKLRQQPGACLHCHSSILPAYREKGDGDIMKGFEVVCGMSWNEARPLVGHPVACIDCHDPGSVNLRVTRPGFLNGIKTLARSDYPLKHFPSITHWREGDRKADYDVNSAASRQEMRTFVCAQCHVEYYFAKPGNLLTYPWHNGLRIEQIEKYYDDKGFHDWKHEITGAEMLKAQHPEFEMWNQGIHARSGVSCADCHMPYVREGAVKISDHHVRSPMLNTARACQVCHHNTEAELVDRVQTIQGRTKHLLDLSENAVVDLMNTIKRGKENKLDAAQLEAARKFHRKAQWRVDFVLSENSRGFHAAQESARILAEAIDFARQGQVAIFTAK